MPRKELSDLFHSGQSPYYAMYEAGLYGYTAAEVTDYCMRLGLPLRSKDYANFENGAMRSRFRNVQYEQPAGGLNPVINASSTSLWTDDLSFDMLPSLPIGWTPPSRRFFPCTSDNRPMMKWGWSKDYTPQLMSASDAQALSVVKGGPGWVGQNMLYQNFIVLDVDGEGHGGRDSQVIAWGSKYASETMTLCDPLKPGSFHLYFATDRIVPVRHFPWAKLDLMGNAVNAAVYFKNKKSNGRSMAELTKEVWDDMMDYVRERKQQCL